jgi:hypothetical protein
VESALFQCSVADLNNLRRCLFGINEGARKSRHDLLAETADVLCFTTVEKVRAWFHLLPAVTRGLVWYACFEDHVPVKLIEDRYGVSLVHRGFDTTWKRPTPWQLKKDTGLDFVSIFDSYDFAIISLPPYLSAAFKHWVVPPPHTLLENCLSTAKGTANGTP